jgi:hypothetical protein
MHEALVGCLQEFEEYRLLLQGLASALNLYCRDSRPARGFKGGAERGSVRDARCSSQIRRVRENTLHVTCQECPMFILTSTSTSSFIVFAHLFPFYNLSSICIVAR